MNPSAIYSKSGKGVQEASGKTSLLKRGDRAVLSAIDGRATLAEVAQKVGKPLDAAFEQLIGQLDKDGFVREVVAGAATTGSRPVIPKPAAKASPPASKAPAAPSGSGEDLDFTSIMPAIKPGMSAPSRAPAANKAADQRAREQESALYKARQEAEARAQAERDRIRMEAEAKARTETEAKIRAETEKRIREEAEAKLRAEADAKAKAAREAALRIAAEAKAKAEAEAKAKIEAERKARAEAERQAREEAEKARREAEELRQRLEEERKAREAEERKRREEEERRRKEEEERRAREEAERKAREEAERKRKEEEERRRKEEEERRAREEAERKAREEAERKAREEAERKAREEAERQRKEEEERRRAEEEARRAREEAERWAREQEERARAAREEEERAERARQEEERAERARQQEERARRSLEETKIRQPTLAAAPPPPEPEPAPVPAAAAPSPARDEGPGSLDSLMADLDSFSQREEDERAARDAAERKLREEKKRKAQEETERRAREEAEHERRQAEERRRKQEEERREQEEAERRVRAEEEQRRLEAEERKRKAKELLVAAKQAQEAADPARASAGAQTDDIGVTDDDLDMADVRQDEAVIAKESRKQQREREREARQREREARERAQAAARAPEQPVKYSKPRRPKKWGRPVAITLFLLLVAAVGVLHVMPLPMDDYEQAASQALGRPVRIASGRLSLFTGVRLNLEGVRIGDNVKIAAVHAYPEIGSLFDAHKTFNRIELEGMSISQDALAETLVAKLKGNDFAVKRILVKQLKLDGPVPLPAFEADAALGPDGALRSAILMGPEELMVSLAPAGRNVEFESTASSFTLPFAPDVHLGSFAMKGVATPQGMNITSWGGSVLGGALSGTANVRWGSNWQVDGMVSIRGINAAVFAPALLSEGKAEGAGKFSMSGTEPAKLASATRIDGSFTINKGVLGSFDLPRAIQTDGRQYTGRTQFVEMTGHGIYDRGSVALRNIIISAGALSAGASADIAQNGALSGRIVADVRTAGQSLRQTLNLGGTVREPQVRN